MSRAQIISRLRRAGCVFAEEEADLLLASAASPDELAVMVDQRVGGLPLEHVLGWVEFYGHSVAVDPGVFVPRRRTELLVAEAVRLGRPGAVVLDLCCGCGAIGLATRMGLGSVELYAADVEAPSVACARRNLEPVGGQVFWGDLFEPLPPAVAGRVDLLLANVPYVPTEAISLMPPEARDHEPRVALDGGIDGLSVLRRVSRLAPRWLGPGGHVLVETSEVQAPLAVAIFGDDGLVARIVTAEDLDATVVVGTRPA